jgi:hypothetical protein
VIWRYSVLVVEEMKKLVVEIVDAAVRQAGGVDELAGRVEMSASRLYEWRAGDVPDYLVKFAQMGAIAHVDTALLLNYRTRIFQLEQDLAREREQRQIFQAMLKQYLRVDQEDGVLVDAPSPGYGERLLERIRQLGSTAVSPPVAGRELPRSGRDFNDELA